MALPFGPLRYLYVGSSDAARDIAAWERIPGVEKVWDFTEFGTRVAGFRIGEGPMWLVAGHRAAPGILPIFAVKVLGKSVAAMAKSGWEPHGDEFEVPDGPCQTFKDPSGNELVLMEERRPRALER
jgi:hypothetical protein